MRMVPYLLTASHLWSTSDRCARVGNIPSPPGRGTFVVGCVLRHLRQAASLSIRLRMRERFVRTRVDPESTPFLPQ